MYRDRNGLLNINLETLLSQYVTSLDGYLGKILDHIQNLIGIAHRNEDLGMNIYGVLKQVEEELEKQIPRMDSIANFELEKQKVVERLEAYTSRYRSHQ